MTPAPIETKFTEPLRHTKLGIASCVLAVLSYIYFFVAGYIALYGLDAMFKDANGLGALAILVISFFIHIAVSSIGFIIGLSFAIVAFTQINRKRLFAVTGLVLNLTPLVLSLALVIYFFVVVPRK